MSHSRDPYDRSHEPQADDVYGQEPWMLDPYADPYAGQTAQSAPEGYTPEQLYAQEPH